MSLIQRFQRLYRHLWSADREVRRAFPPTVLTHIEKAVAASESRHAGEVRVVIEGGLGWQGWHEVDSHARAIALFAQLGVWDTAENSGVLIYILMAEHRIEVLGDRGIHARVGDATWQHIVASTTERFKSGDYEQGLLDAIHRIEALLAEFFPAAVGNSDELPNRPVVL